MKNMKIAYIGYDQSSYLASEFLHTLSDHVQFYLIHPEQNNNFKNFSEIDIHVNHVMIPAQAEMRTAEQKKQFEAIKNNYNTLYRWICDYKPAGHSTFTLSDVSREKSNTTNARDIVDVRVDDRQKKCFVEVKQKGLEEYDLILTEDHNLISHFFQEKSIKYFRKLSNQKRSWVGYTFAIQYVSPKKPIANPIDFFLVNQSMHDSIVDNFYLIRLSASQINVWQWLPAHQLDNPQFDKFIIEKIRSLVAKKISFISLNSTEPVKIKTTVNAESDQKIFLDGLFLSIPNFTFWDHEHIADYLKKRLDKKVKDYLKEVERKKREAERLKEKSNREMNP